MKKSIFIATVLAVLIISCQTNSNDKTNTMDKDKIKAEVMQAEDNLLTALRQGELVKGVSMHLNSPGYRNIWNGEIKTFNDLETRIKMGMEKGLKSIDYKIQTREFNFINADNVLETITATETTTMSDGNSATSGVTAISILWQRIDTIWKLGYLHASELPKEN